MAGPLNLNSFSGLQPRIPATSLPSNGATVAENIDFSSGELQSLRADFKLRDLAVAAQSVFSEDGMRFYAWSEDVNPVPSPLQSGVSHDLLYYTSNDDFRVTRLSLATPNGAAPSTSYRVGVPRPKVRPVVTVVHPAAPTSPIATVSATPADTYEVRLEAAQKALNAAQIGSTQSATLTRAYTYCYRNIYNEQGPPSDPVVVEIKAVTSNNITTYSTVTIQITFDNNSEYVPITSADIFRTADSASGDEYFYCFAVAGSSGAVSTVDTTAAGALNEVLASLNFYPPDPQLKGLFHLGNGILAAWKGRELWFSDAYKPWSWPPSYVLTFPHSIVGAMAHGAGALVTTVGEPVLVSGVGPDAMTQMPLAIPQAGVSKWAMLSLQGMAVYACNDGIVAVVGGQPDMRISSRFFTRNVWRERYGAGLSSMQFSYYDGRLVVFSKANAFVPFMLQLDEANGAMTELPKLVAKTAFVLVTTDQMYTTNGSTLNQFGGGADLPMRWRSADIVLPAPTVLTTAQAECVGNFVVSFFQNGKLGYTKELTTGSTIFKLPSQAIPGHAGLTRSDRWQFEITGAGNFKWMKAARSGRELMEV